MGYVKEISLQRFNTLFYRRKSSVSILYKEIKWYELLDSKLYCKNIKYFGTLMTLSFKLLIHYPD